MGSDASRRDGRVSRICYSSQIRDRHLHLRIIGHAKARGLFYSAHKKILSYPKDKGEKGIKGDKGDVPLFAFLGKG
jgi:hypothetical protein